MSEPSPQDAPAHRVGSDSAFYWCLGILSGVYVFLIGAMLLADAGYVFVPRAYRAIDRKLDQFYFWQASPSGETPSKSTTSEPTEAQARFQAREAKLSELRDAHVIGETEEGLVEAVTAKLDETPKISPETAALLKEENADRTKLFAIIAHEVTMTADQVADRESHRRFTLAAPDHLLKKGSKWVPRREVDVAEYGPIVTALRDKNVQYSIYLSLISCTITTILSLWIAVPIGYLMSRVEFRGKAIVDAILDIPIVLPPLVVGLSLLILFRIQPSDWLREHVVFEVPAIILAQFMVACAFAVRTMRATFDHISTRREQVALTLGCTRGQAFFAVVLPEAKRGMVTAGTLAWARALGEFGPILVFAGSTRLHTEVLPTTVFLELQAGNLHGAIAVSLIMVVAAVAVLILARTAGVRNWGIG